MVEFIIKYFVVVVVVTNLASRFGSFGPMPGQMDVYSNTLSLENLVNIIKTMDKIAAGSLYN